MGQCSMWQSWGMCKLKVASMALLVIDVSAACALVL
jgi:hypothetical protein